MLALNQLAMKCRKDASNLGAMENVSKQVARFQRESHAPSKIEHAIPLHDQV